MATLQASCVLLVAAILFSASLANPACKAWPRGQGELDLEAMLNHTTAEVVAEVTKDPVGDNLDHRWDDCRCMPFRLCISNKIDQRKVCDDNFDVCCAVEEIVKLDIRTSNVKTPDISGVATWPVPAISVGCGQRNVPSAGNVAPTADKPGQARFAEFPWMVALYAGEPGSGELLGGGSLINPSIVLTSAHLVDKYKSLPQNLTARVGEWNLGINFEPLPPQDLAVREVAVHPRFISSSLQNDIALLSLSKRATRAGNVGTVCLPEPEAEPVADSDGCIVTGWGKDKYGAAGCYNDVLKAIPLPIVLHRACQDALRKTKNITRSFRLHPNTTCAGGRGGADACVGDSGGPMICPIPGARAGLYHQVGVVSWGVGCGDVGVPSVYTSVAKFRQWIDDKFEQMNLDIESYLRP